MHYYFHRDREGNFKFIHACVTIDIHANHDYLIFSQKMEAEKCHYLKEIL